RDSPDGSFEPALVVAEKDNDLSYLVLDGNRRQEKNNPWIGRAYLDEGYEANMFSERGLYRPGDTLYLNAIVRDEKVVAPPGNTPFTLRINRPDGRRLSEYTLLSSAQGEISLNTPMSNGLPTGRYTATLSIPGSEKILGECHWELEEYMPRNLEMTTTLSDHRIYGEFEPRLKIKGRFLFGESSAGLEARLRIHHRGESPKFPELPEYLFGDARKETGSARLSLPAKTMDEKGEASFEFGVESLPDS
ncbi:MAG: hypothetical protein HQL31_14130, partial [Planctomycetes bacterium]|nr:hypothetical protein [Planctomycetota bacterium]